MLTYDITVRNEGTADTSYDLDDELRYGQGITVSSAAVSNAEPGSVVTSPAWDGTTHLRIATDVALAGGDVHVYRVVVTATVPGGSAATALDCTVGTSETGTGFLNEAVLTSNGPALDDDACASAEQVTPPTTTTTTTTTTTPSTPTTTPTTLPRGPVDPAPVRPPTGRDWPTSYLPHTGAEVARLVVVGVVLLSAGWALVLFRRRRYAR